MGEDKFEIEILGDGSLKILTDEISPANHRNADDLMKFLQQKMGGPTEISKKKDIGRTVPEHVHRKA